MTAAPLFPQPALQEDIRQATAAAPFAMPAIALAQFPDRTVSIADHGAVPDGTTLNTEAFAKAIRACASAGGGTVLIPPGVWLTGPIKLESNINLHAAQGAVVLFSRKFGDFPLIQRPGTKKYSIMPPIYAAEAENIAVTGKGVFDGSGHVWRPMKKEKQTSSQWKALVASGGVVSPDGKIWWPSREAMKGEEYLKELGKKKNATAEEYAGAREFLRPDLLMFVRCNRILIDGPTFQNSPKFCVHPIECEDLVIRDITAKNEWYAQNGDGIDLASVRRAVVLRARVDVGDDALCLKPGSNKRADVSCEHIVIADCIVYHGHGGFVIGSETDGGARNVFVTNCVFNGTDVGLRFKSLRGRGGLIEKMYIDNIRMVDIRSEAILFDTFYESGSPEANATDEARAGREKQEVNARTPQFRDFSIRNVVCVGAERALLIIGLPEMPVRAIAMENVRIEARKGALCVDAEGITLSRCVVRAAEGPLFQLNHVSGMKLEGVSGAAEGQTFVRAAGEDTKAIVLRGCAVPKHDKAIVLAPGVPADAVRVE